MVNEKNRLKIESLAEEYRKLLRENISLAMEIARSEVPEMVYNSNAIENSTLTLKETTEILLHDQIVKDASVREVYEAKNLGNAMEKIMAGPQEKLSVPLILELHRTLLSGINDKVAGRFRSGDEWVRVGVHFGANPDFVSGFMHDLVEQYNNDRRYFLEKIAYFHDEFETIHPFNDGNGRIGRLLINQQLMALGFPPVVIQSKGKYKDYYPVFDAYRLNGDTKPLEELLSLLLMEALNKRITIMRGMKIVPLYEYAKQTAVVANGLTNKARRQTIPAFRVEGKWMIGVTD